MYFFIGPFIAAIIFIAFVMMFPILIKKMFQLESLELVKSGIIYNIFFIIIVVVSFVLFIIIIVIKGLSVGFFFTVSEFFLDLNFNLRYWIFLCYAIVQVAAFPILLCGIKRVMTRISQNKQILSFLAGFNFSFAGVFIVNLLHSLSLFIKDVNIASAYLIGYSYPKQIFAMEFFVFTYMLHINGIILLIFTWQKMNNKLMLFIALGAMAIPAILYFIGIAVRNVALAEYVTPVAFLLAPAVGFFFFKKNADDVEGDSGTSMGEFIPQS